MPVVLPVTGDEFKKNGILPEVHTPAPSQNIKDNNW
jgi:hypothetical protein